MTDITLQGGPEGVLNNSATGVSAPGGASAFAGRSGADADWAFSPGALAGVPAGLARTLARALGELGARIDAVAWPETAAPSSLTPGRDPDAPTTLAPGTYTLPGAAAGEEIRIVSGDTWGTVLARLARTFGVTGMAELSRLAPVTRGVLSEGGVERLARSVSDVLDGYNEVADLLVRNADRLGANAPADWGAPARSRSAALAGLGVERTGARLWLFGEAFLSAVAEDPAAVRETLLGADGFLPALRGAAQAALAAAGESAAEPSSAVAAPADPLARIFGSRGAARPASATGSAGALVDAYDAQGTAGPEGTVLLSAARLVHSLG